MALGTVTELELRAGLRVLKPKLPEEEEAPVWKDELCYLFFSSWSKF